METPKLTVDEYCEKFRAWAKIMREVYAEQDKIKKEGGQPHYPQGEDFIIHLAAVELAIGKSSLLNRTIYGGQEPRTQKCPLHQGHWSGLYFKRPVHHWDPKYHGGQILPECECWDGWECSGWIPEKPVTGFIGNQVVGVYATPTKEEDGSTKKL